MNSEELELSLRSEFENYLKNVRAEMRQEAAELQKRFDEALQAFAARFDAEQEFDEAFKSTVTEHLRLARDEGAKLTAEALAEAEQMDRDSAAANYAAIRDAVADIGGQTSQSAILKALVDHAAQFAPRGAFFIIKNEHFLGWKVFGEDVGNAEAAIREVHFPMSGDTILGRAVESMSTIDSAYGAHQDDRAFLEPLGFAQPDRMYAIPLTARGRGVAVMYADLGNHGTKVNIEALETLVRIAGLTVELLAASHTAKVEGRDTGAADFEHAHHDVPASSHTFGSPGETDAAPQAYEAPVDTYEAPAETPATDFSFAGSAPSDEPSSPSYDEAPAYEPAPQFESSGTPFEPDTTPFDQRPTESFEHPAETGGAMVFDSGGSIEPAVMETAASPFEATAAPEPATVGIGGGMGSMAPERGIEVSPHSAVGHTRLSDRPVDLPIDVAEDERRLHNDARRFARLLVSEIKLYNEKKVQEGRQANDLYDRLREAIDRSREMYDKRVQPPVAAKFDYFHYELVNALADGNAERLGAGYPGASV